MLLLHAVKLQGIIYMGKSFLEKLAKWFRMVLKSIGIGIQMMKETAAVRSWDLRSQIL